MKTNSLTSRTMPLLHSPNSNNRQESTSPPPKFLLYSKNCYVAHVNMAPSSSVYAVNDMVDEVIQSANREKSEYDEKLSALRHYVLKNSFPSSASDYDEHSCSLRGTVWKSLVGVGKLDEGEYESLVLKGPSKEHLRIREDALRTFRHGSVSPFTTWFEFLYYLQILSFNCEFLRISWFEY